MTIPAIQPSVEAADIPLERLADAAIPEASKVTELSRQFESMLVRQILSGAFKPVFQSALLPNSVTQGIYQDMMVSQLADQISQSGPFGLSTALGAQLLRESGTAKDQAAPTNTPFTSEPESHGAPELLRLLHRARGISSGTP